MPTRRTARAPLYNTPTLRNGGFGVLQVEAITNRPASIARRHLAASTLRMRAIEPDELSSSDWVRFLVMEERERDRWMGEFLVRRRRDSGGSEGSVSEEGSGGKEAEARREGGDAAAGAGAVSPPPSTAAATSPVPARRSAGSAGTTPTASLWARHFDEEDGGQQRRARPRHTRALTAGPLEAPPTYETAVRARTPPPAYEPRSDDEGAVEPRMRVRFDV